MRTMWVLVLGAILSLMSLNLSNKLNISVPVPNYKVPEPSAEVREVWRKIDRKETLFEKDSQILDKYSKELERSRKNLKYDPKVVSKLIRNATLPWMAGLWLIALFFLIRRRKEVVIVLTPPILFSLLGFIHIYELLVVVCCGLIIFIYKSLKKRTNEQGMN